jgi:hypothetical protein
VQELSSSSLLAKDAQKDMESKRNERAQISLGCVPNYMCRCGWCGDLLYPAVDN